MIIDEMLEMTSSVDKFKEAVNEKIIKKYNDVMLDADSRQIYNDIKRYKRSLKNFKKALSAFKNQEKEKSQYFSDRALINSFGMYSAFSDYERL